MSTTQPHNSIAEISHAHEGVTPTHKSKAHGALDAWEIYLFAILCTADMVTTIYWFDQGKAVEANPLLSYWLQKSVAAFCVAKLLSFMPLLIVCAYYRNKYKTFITKALRLAMAAYVIIYSICIAGQFINP